jgi:uncharacterized protein (DUF1330 family)
MMSSTPLGYCLAEITVTDPEAYKDYMARSGPAVAAAGGRFLIRGGQPEVIEGDRHVTRLVLVEFPSAEAAFGFYQGAQYREVIPYRTRAASCHYTILSGNDPANVAGRSGGGGKGYVYAEMHPTDLEKYMEYPKLSTPIVREYGGIFIVRGGQPKIMEGDRPPGRVVIVEFASPQRAREFYHSPEYQEALKYRQRHANSHLYLLQGA